MSMATKDLGSYARFDFYNDNEPIARCNGSISTVRPEAYLSSFFVEPCFRGKGFGQSFLSLIIDYYKSANLNAITLRVYKGNSAALRVYEKLGFEYIMTRLHIDLFYNGEPYDMVRYL